MRYGRVNLYLDYEKAGVRNKPDRTPYFDAYLLDDPMKGSAGVKKRDALIVIPGGGYHDLSSRESDPIAFAFSAKGCQTFVLYYTVGKSGVFPMALMELALAVKTVRAHADEWEIDPDRIFIAGFSAGGHLAASLANFYDKEFLLRALDATEDEIKPNGCILAYPVITSKEFAHRNSFRYLLGETDPDETLLALNSLEDQVSEKTSPTFLWHTMTDQTVPVENALLYAQALRKNHIDAEIHIFRRGCHGLALANRETDANGRFLLPTAEIWTELAAAWMQDLSNEA